jgi:hypothetical protein
MRSLLRLSVVAVLVVAGVGANTHVAGAAAAHPLVLHLKFRRVAKNVDGNCGNPVLTSGRYAVVSFSHGACYSGFLLLDDKTGKQAPVHGNGCNEDLAVGAPWVLADCHLTFRLYNIQTQKWRPLRCGPPGCMPNGTFAFHVGSRWLQFDVQEAGSCGDGVHNTCGPITHTFYNITTGARRHAPHQTAATIIDLASPTLVRTVCRPLRVPSGGSLTFYGSFAVATDKAGNLSLERCGSHMQIPIDQRNSAGLRGSLLASDRAVLWPAMDAAGAWQTLDGVLLPSLRRITIPLPQRVTLPGGGFVALDSYKLYSTNIDGELWSAGLPRSR